MPPPRIWYSESCWPCSEVTLYICRSCTDYTHLLRHRFTELFHSSRPPLVLSVDAIPSSPSDVDDYSEYIVLVHLLHQGFHQPMCSSTFNLLPGFLRVSSVDICIWYVNTGTFKYTSVQPIRMCGQCSFGIRAIISGHRSPSQSAWPPASATDRHPWICLVH